MRVLRGFMKAFAIILCIVLFFSCFTAVVLSVAVDLASVNTLRRIATQVDLTDILGNSQNPSYEDVYAAAVPGGLLAAGPVRLLPLSALTTGEGSAFSEEDMEELLGDMEELLGDTDLDALGAELETIFQSKEMEEFLEYAETYLEEHPVLSKMDEHAFTEALESQAVKAVVKDLINEMVDLLLTEDRASYNIERVGAVIDKHAPGICEAIGAQLDDEFFDKAKEAAESVAKGIAESDVLPPADKLMDVVISGAMEGMGDELAQINGFLGLPADASASETVAALRSLLNSVVTVAWCCVAVLVGLIALLWWNLYRWTLPVGITALLVGGVLLCAGLMGNVALQMMPSDGVPVAELVSVAVLSRFNLYGGIIVAVGVLCIAAYIVLRIVLRNKGGNQQPPVEEIPTFKDAVKV